MSKMSEIFLEEYARNMANSISLPEPIKGEYLITGSLKESDDKSVYFVSSTSGSKKYILKYVTPYSKEDLASEYSILKSLSHPGLPGAVYYASNDNGSYLIREYFNGCSLLELIRNKGAMPGGRCMNIMLQLCDIVNYLHTRNPPVIHRDLSPQNIIITPEGECKLIDMGISRLFKPEETKDTVFMGTEATAAPEQFGYMQTGPRSDVYSLGVLMFYMLTGSFDIQLIDEYAIVKALKSIIKKCVAFSPEARFASAMQLRAALAGYGRRQSKPKLTKRTTVFAAVIAALILPIALYLYFCTPRGVVFSSPLIENAVRQALGKNAGEPIAGSDLSKVTKLLICGEKVYSSWDEHQMYGADNHMNGVSYNDKGSVDSLEDLEKMTNLRELALYSQDIRDLTPLKGLKNLARLGLGGNSIVDISPLRDLNRIEVLNIADNPIADISVINEMASVKELDISACFVNDFSTLEGLYVENLSALDDPITDYSALTKLPALRVLRMRSVSREGLDTVLKLSTLEQLTLYDSNINNVAIFSSLPGLQMLDVFANEVSDLKGIENLKQLRHICFGSNKVSDLTPLIGNESIQSLDINGSRITDYTPLLKIPYLKTVFCNSTEALEIKKILGDKDIQVIVNF